MLQHVTRFKNETTTTNRPKKSILSKTGRLEFQLPKLWKLAFVTFIMTAVVCCSFRPLKWTTKRTIILAAGVKWPHIEHDSVRCDFKSFVLRIWSEAKHLCWAEETKHIAQSTNYGDNRHPTTNIHAVMWSIRFLTNSSPH